MIKINMEQGWVAVEAQGGAEERYPLGSPQGFAIISKAWLRSGWDTKYVYGFSWMGRPIIQLPEDMIRIQEVLYQVRPDVLIEVGVAHGGSLIFYASLFKAMGHGRVVGIDIEIRKHNREAIERHELSPYITLIEGDSVSAPVLQSVSSELKPGEKGLVMLDGNHTKAHVLAELEKYAPFVGIDSYLVAADGIMGSLVGAPRSAPDWSWNNPRAAAEEFVSHNPDFVIEEPAFPFQEGMISERVTYWPSAFVRRRS